MLKDFFPSKDAELLIWLNSFRTKFATYAYDFATPPEDVGNLDMLINEMSIAVQEVATQKDMLAKTVAHKESMRKRIEAAVRAEANRLKSHKNYTEAIGQELGIISGKSIFNPATYKPMPKSEVSRGIVRIKFKKKGIDGVNVYCRRKGEVAWQFRGRDNNSPYDERIVLTNLAQPEHWEYRLIGVIKDEEIGQPSDVIEVIVGA